MIATAVPAKRIDPRKGARQERSRAKLDAVFEAMDVVLARDGINAFTVSDVARAARIGKASIYDYYPTREALVAAWEERQIERELVLVGNLVMQLLVDPPSIETSIHSIVTLVFDISHERAIKFHYERELAAPARSSVRQDVIERVVQMMASALGAHPDLHRMRAPLDMTARLAVHAVLGMAHICALESHEMRTAQARELARMISRYLPADCEE